MKTTYIGTNNTKPTDPHLQFIIEILQELEIPQIEITNHTLYYNITFPLTSLLLIQLYANTKTHLHIISRTKHHEFGTYTQTQTKTHTIHYSNPNCAEEIKTIIRNHYKNQ